ncbi:MAG: flagellar hook-length control protein FliK [Bacillota bacterium]
MRIELIPTNQAQLTGKSGLEPESVALERGEIINARAINQNGDALVFRSQDGRIFSAKLSDPSLILPGDQVEFMVTGSCAGRVVLHLLGVDPAAQRYAPAGGESLASNGIRMDAAAAELVKLLQSMDRTTSPETLQKAVALMKEQGLDVREAAFFVANNKEGTKAQIGALRSFAGGETLGSTLRQIAATIVDADGDSPARQIAAGGELPAEQGNAVKGGGSARVPAGETGTKESAAVPQTADSSARGIQAASKIEQPVPADMAGELQNLAERTAQTAKQALQPARGARPAPEGPMASPADGIQKTDALRPETVRMPPDVAKVDQSVPGRKTEAPAQEQSDSAPGGMRFSNAPELEDGINQKTDFQRQSVSKEADLPGAKALGGLAEKLLSAFTEFENSVSGASIKKNAAAAKDQLVALARLTADGKEAEALAPKLVRAAAQGMLFQDLDRIAFAQIPVHLKQYDTAELYVYKRSKRGRSIDAENTSMLIGLTTENLGRIETLVRVERKNLSLSFYVENQELTAEVKDKLDDLVVALNGLGFRVSGAKVDLLKERTTPQTAEKTLAAAIKKTGVGFDCRI